MRLLPWIVGAALCLIGLWVSILNWGVVWSRFRGRVPVPSWIPLLGGSSLALGLAILPEAHLSRFWWVAFFADWGCIPGFTQTACAFALEYWRRR